MLKYHSINQLH